VPVGLITGNHDLEVGWKEAKTLSFSSTVGWTDQLVVCITCSWTFACSKCAPAGLTNCANPALAAASLVTRVHPSDGCPHPSTPRARNSTRTLTTSRPGARCGSGRPRSTAPPPPDCVTAGSQPAQCLLYPRSAFSHGRVTLPTAPNRPRRPIRLSAPACSAPSPRSSTSRTTGPPTWAQHAC
jgi:hypothetical protein